MNGLKRVVITGSGIYSALGFTPGELFENLVAGRSAIVRGGEEEDFLPTAPAPRSANSGAFTRWSGHAG